MPSFEAFELGFLSVPVLAHICGMSLILRRSIAIEGGIMGRCDTKVEIA